MYIVYFLDSFIKSGEYEELKKICLQQEQEVSMPNHYLAIKFYANSKLF